MSQSTTSSRYRLQFSLRAMLVFTLLVGVGIAVYRWPWVVASNAPDGYWTKTRYRRSWHGTPVKHGWETKEDWQLASPDDDGEHPRATIERLYEEGDLRIERTWWRPTDSRTELRYRDGVLHGPCWAKHGSEGIKTRQEHRFGKKHGEMKWETPDYIIREQWRDDLQHGRSTWESKSGRVWQSAEYERGRLTKWNDRPVQEELRRWLMTNVPDPEVRQTLLTPVPSSAPLQINHSGYLYRNYRFGNPPRDVVLEFDGPMDSGDVTRWAGQLFGEVLLEEAFACERTLAYRFHSLQMVRIDAELAEWRDRTSIDSVQFTQGSEQEKFWGEEVADDEIFVGYPVTRLRQLFPGGGEAPIEIDTTAWNDFDPPVPKARKMPFTVRRIRRDYLGQLLDLEDSYVEQQGNKLIIKRHSDRE